MKSIRRTLTFRDWLANLKDRRGAGRITTALEKLSVGLGDVEPVGEGVSELKLNFGPGYRCYFVEREGAIIVMLCGGDKDSQARDIKEAKAMAKKLE